jgi:hypothetical protein
LANNLGELSAIATLNNQKYLAGLKGMADQTKSQTAAIKSSFASLSTIGGALGIGGAGGLAAMLGLDLLGKAREGWRQIGIAVGVVRSEVQAGAAAMTDLDRRYNAAVTANTTFNRVRESLSTQVRQLGMGAADRAADPFRDRPERAEWVREQHRIIDSFREFSESVRRATETIRELRSPVVDFQNRLAEITARPEGNAQNPWLPVPALNDDERARGVARLFQSLPGLGDTAMPNFLERGSVGAASAINTAASSRGNSVAELISRMDAMVASQEREERLGRDLLAAMRDNPRLRGLLSR